MKSGTFQGWFQQRSVCLLLLSVLFLRSHFLITNRKTLFWFDTFDPTRTNLGFIIAIPALALNHWWHFANAHNVTTQVFLTPIRSPATWTRWVGWLQQKGTRLFANTNQDFWCGLFLGLCWGELSKQIFGKSWEFGPTGLTPPPPQTLGFFPWIYRKFSAKKGSNMA